jgi:sugar phosphate isomerase/epimerase
MKLSIQEDMLPGRTLLEKLENAKQLGIEGVEFWGHGLTERVPEIIAAIEQTGVLASSVCHGRQSRFLDPDSDERERALAELRRSLCDAVDIGAKGVTFIPHYDAPLLPDLTPFKSPIELEVELLVWHLRTLEDFAYAVGVELYIEPANRYMTHFINRLEQAAAIRHQIQDHPHVKIVADTFHMMLEESNPVQAIRDHGKDIGHIHLADSNRRLPGQGMIDFAAIAAALHEVGYDGWTVFECGTPTQNQPHAKQYMADLPESIAMLRRSGF